MSTPVTFQILVRAWRPVEGLEPLGAAADPRSSFKALGRVADRLVMDFGDEPVRAGLEKVIAEQEDRARLAVRDHDVTGLTGRQPEGARRELQANLALVRPDSPAGVPILAQMSAIDTHLARRTGERPEDLPDSPLPR